MACASAPIAIAVTAAYTRFGARAAGAESPNSPWAPADIQ